MQSSAKSPWPGIFLPEEVHHLLIEIISAIVFAIVAGQAGTEYYFHFETPSIILFNFAAFFAPLPFG